MTTVAHLFKRTATEWLDDKAPLLGAALAYYTVFSLAAHSGLARDCRPAFSQ
jgi:membrane protein